MKKTAADEIAFEMSQSLKDEEPKTDTSEDQVLAALAHLDSAAELLDSVGLSDSAGTITNIMVETASLIGGGK